MTDEKYIKRKYGALVLKKMILLVRNIEIASNLAELRKTRSRFIKPMTNDKKGLWSIRVTGTKYRVLFRPLDDGGSEILVEDLLRVMDHVTGIGAEEVWDHE